MSIDYATLGIEVKTSGLKEGEAELRTFANVAQDTDRRVGRATSEMTRGFRLNRIGMMEMQAAGINSFQALAAGMSPLRVATMESSQVIGAFIQGTEGGVTALRSFGAAMLSAINPIAAIGAGVAAVGVGGLVYEFTKASRAASSLQSALTDLAAAQKTADAAFKLAVTPVADLKKKYGELADTIYAVNIEALKNATVNFDKKFESAGTSLRTVLSGLQGAIKDFNSAGQNEGVGTLRGYETGITNLERLTREYGLTSSKVATQIARDMSAVAYHSHSPAAFAVNAQSLVDEIGKLRDKSGALPAIWAKVDDQLIPMIRRAADLNNLMKHTVDHGQAFAATDMTSPLTAASAAAAMLELHVSNALRFAQGLAGVQFPGSGAGSSGGVIGFNRSPYVTGVPVGQQTGQAATDNGYSMGIVVRAAPKTPASHASHVAAGIKKLTDAQKEEKSILQQLQGPLKAYQTTQQALDDLLKRKVITQSEYNAKLGDAKVKYMQADEAGKFYLQTTQTFEQSMSQAIVTGKGFASVLANIAEKFAEAKLQAALFGTGPASHGGTLANPSHSLFGGLISGLLGGGGGTWSGGGGTVTPLFASGTSYAPGGTAIVGENGPEAVNLPRGAQIVPARQTAAMMGGGSVDVHVFVDQGGNWQAKVAQISGAVSAQAVKLYDQHSAPAMVNRVLRDPTVRGV